MLPINGDIAIAGALSVDGNIPPLAILSTRALVYAPTVDASGDVFPLTLSPDVLSSPGAYAVLYSPVPFTGFVGASAATWTKSPHLTVTYQTGAGTGQRVVINGTTYYALVVEVA